MKAILDGDVIIAKSSAGIDVGPVPNDVGLERLRYDVSIPGVVDLMTLSAIYVEHRGGNFILHAVSQHPVTGKTYTLITMAYTDRRNLIQELNGTIRLLTPTEITARDQAILDDMTDSRNLKAEARDIIQNLSYADIGTHIDTVFAALTTAQKNSLKKLYRAVLYLAKKAAR